MINCPHCQQHNISTARYCSSCGKMLDTSLAEKELKKAPRLKSLLVFYFLQLVFVGVLHLDFIKANFATMLTADCLYMGITLVFVFLNFSEIKPLFSSQNIRLWHLPVIVVCAILAALFVNKLADTINSLNKTQYYFYYYEDTKFPFLMGILFIGFSPAIFEELAFRGVMQNHLNHISGPTASAIAVSLMFAILHLSPLSCLWLLPIGLVAAWMRNRFNHLWYGMLLHLTYNSTHVWIYFYHTT